LVGAGDGGGDFYDGRSQIKRGLQDAGRWVGEKIWEGGASSGGGNKSVGKGKRGRARQTHESGCDILKKKVPERIAGCGGQTVT